MNKLQFKFLVMESLRQALSEITSASRAADLAAIDAQIKALQLQLSELNKAKAEKGAEQITTESIDEEIPELKNKLIGGKGDKLKPSNVDKKELLLGIKEEMEHTNDDSIAMEICLDHLTIDPKYYTHLKAMENKTKKQIGENIMELKDFYFDEDIIKEEKDIKYSCDKFNVFAKKKIIARVYVKRSGENEIRILQGMPRGKTIKKIIEDCPEFAKKYKLTNNYYPRLFAEAKEEKVSEIKNNFEDIDLVNYFQLQLGINFETNRNKEIDINKAKEIALQNLLKNPVYYTDLEDDESRKNITHGNKESSFFKEKEIEDDMIEFTDKNKEKGQIESVDNMDTDKKLPAAPKNKKVKQMKESTKQTLKSIITEVLNEEKSKPLTSIPRIKKPKAFETECIEEDRLGPEDAEYKTESGKIFAYLKKKKAEIFTKLIKSLEEIESLQAQIKIKKDEIAAQSKEQEDKYGEKDEQLRVMVTDLFDTSEVANTLYVEANGALLTLAKKTEKNAPTEVTPITTDYKKAWDAVTALYTESNIGLVDQMNEVLKQFTIVGQTYVKPGAKRRLTRGVKEESILRDVINEFKLLDIWNSVKLFLSKFKLWTKVFNKKLDITNQIIEQL